MSGQWEVVRGKNDRRSKVPVPKSGGKQSESKAKKPNILNGVKIEEVLPKSQVQNLYSGKQSNKENKPQEKAKASETKKSEKKANKSPPEPPKPKPPKSIEAGLLAIKPEEFSSIYERSKTSFPDAPIVWLKELTQFLNQKIPLDVQDPVFSNKPLGYPLNIVPSNIRITLEKAINDAGKGNAQLYFDIALTSMVTDLSKGLPAIGYRFFLQYIALNEPKLVADNLHKHISLRNSYQNRANVALSILWAVGFVGVNDLQSGLKVFEELMLPVLELKSYSRYVVKYLLDLTSREDQTLLSRDQYLLILDTVFSNKKNFPAELQKELVQNLPKLKSLLFSSKKEKLGGSVELFLKKIASNSNSAYQNCLCDIIIEIFSRDSAALASYHKAYPKNLLASAVLFNYIGDNYDNVKPNVRKSLKEWLPRFVSINEELSLKKRKDEGLKEAIIAIKKVQEQKKAPKKGGGFFRKLLSFLLFVVWVAVLTEPLYRPSKPRDELCIFRLASKLGDAAQWADVKLEQSIVKPYYLQVKEVWQPYGALAGDLRKAFVNILENVRAVLASYVNEKYPVVVASIDSYAPGLIDNTQVIFRDAFAKTTYYYQTGVNYLQKEVFVGQLSPENIQRVVVRAYNTTSEKAIEYYHWVSEKVQTSIK